MSENGVEITADRTAQTTFFSFPAFPPVISICDGFWLQTSKLILSFNTGPSYRKVPQTLSCLRLRLQDKVIKRVQNNDDLERGETRQGKQRHTISKDIHTYICTYQKNKRRYIPALIFSTRPHKTSIK